MSGVNVIIWCAELGLNNYSLLKVFSGNHFCNTLIRCIIPIGVLAADDPDVAMETEPLANGTEPAPEVVQEELPPLSAAELFANRQKKLTEKKRTIALLSSALIENPEQNASYMFVFESFCSTVY